MTRGEKKQALEGLCPITIEAGGESRDSSDIGGQRSSVEISFYNVREMKEASVRAELSRAQGQLWVQKIQMR